MSRTKKLIIAAICLLLASAIAVSLTVALIPRKIAFSSPASSLSVTLLSGEADGSTRIDHAEFGSFSAEADTICAFLRDQEYRCGFAPQKWGGRMVQLLFVDECGKAVSLAVDEQGKISFNGERGVLLEGAAAAEELFAAILPYMRTES